MKRGPLVIRCDKFVTFYSQQGMKSASRNYKALQSSDASGALVALFIRGADHTMAQSAARAMAAEDAQLARYVTLKP